MCCGQGFHYNPRSLSSRIAQSTVRPELDPPQYLEPGFSVGTFNVGNYFDAMDDPDVQDMVYSTEGYYLKQHKLALLLSSYSWKAFSRDHSRYLAQILKATRFGCNLISRQPSHHRIHPITGLKLPVLFTRVSCWCEANSGKLKL